MSDRGVVPINEGYRWGTPLNLNEPINNYITVSYVIF
jgi:hypothetical protein